MWQIIIYSYESHWCWSICKPFHVPVTWHQVGYSGGEAKKKWVHVHREVKTYLAHYCSPFMLFHFYVRLFLLHAAVWHRSAAELPKATHDGLLYYSLHMEHLQTVFAWNQWSDANTHKGAAETCVGFVCIAFCSVADLETTPVPWKPAGNLLQTAATGGAKQIRFF